MAQTEISATIVETISIAAPIHKVFAALTEPEEVVQWWGSEDAYVCDAMERDLRVGGAWKTSGTMRDGKPFCVEGVYRVVQPPSLLEFTWRYDWNGGDPVGETIVRYDLNEHDGVTELRVTHVGFTDVDARNGHAAGWPMMLGWLNAYLTR